MRVLSAYRKNLLKLLKERYTPFADNNELVKQRTPLFSKKELANQETVATKKRAAAKNSCSKRNKSRN